MRSYLLGIVVAILLSAIYAFSNTGAITVSFLNLKRDFPQGIWEILLFAAGAVLMWLFSVAASFELYAANRKKNRETAKRIAELEEEKKSLLTALRRIGENTDFQARTPAKTPEYESYKKTPQEDETPAAIVQTPAEPENKKTGESAPSFLKNLFGSFFSGGEKTEAGEARSPSAFGLSDETEKGASDLAASPETAKTSESCVLKDDEKKETFTV
ncbi:MAG: LapA family protein [Synergistaceae bacterium]|jgi:uncharacterized integral membrane protein|nr:LapA family protein [Synergistaceae bacterium]